MPEGRNAEQEMFLRVQAKNLEQWERADGSEQVTDRKNTFIPRKSNEGRPPTNYESQNKRRWAQDMPAGSPKM